MQSDENEYKFEEISIRKMNFLKQIPFIITGKAITFMPTVVDSSVIFLTLISFQQRKEGKKNKTTNSDALQTRITYTLTINKNNYYLPQKAKKKNDFVSDQNILFYSLWLLHEIKTHSTVVWNMKLDKKEKNII